MGGILGATQLVAYPDVLILPFDAEEVVVKFCQYYKMIEQPRGWPLTYFIENKIWYVVLCGKGITFMVTQDADLVKKVVTLHEEALLLHFDSHCEVTSVLAAYNNTLNHFTTYA
jgi:hypothetical protein